MNMKYRILGVSLALFALGIVPSSRACTGISLTAKDGSHVVARTIEWGGSNLHSSYVVVPRGYTQQSYTPDGQKNGMTFSARYGFVGMAVENEAFVVEGLNEVGLSAGLFYFPNYGKYPPYDAQKNAQNIADMQLVSLILGNCQTVDEVQKLVQQVRVVSIDPRASTVHWRFTESSGRQVVLEIVEGESRFYENELGVLTNAPGFEWQLTNLNNYVNLHAGSAAPKPFGTAQLISFGAGSGMLGLPGDVTPPSRFVRAAFYQTTAPQADSAHQAVLQGFQILSNFDIPIGTEFAAGEPVTDIPSATQWTAAADLKNLKIYYRTMYNSAIRGFDLRSIDFERVAYQTAPLDRVTEQPVTRLQIQ